MKFPDGEVKEYAANVITETMLGQVDSEGFTIALLDAILDSKKDKHAVAKEDQYVIIKRGDRRLSKTTCGWKLLVRWKDGSKSWIPLKDMKESHQVESAEFARARGIDTEPAFV